MRIQGVDKENLLNSSIKRKTLTGTVVSAKMDKTAVIEVERVFAHSKFKKVVRNSKKFKVHDEDNQCEAGDLISIGETRPLSKSKRWRLLEIIKKANPAEKAAAK